jgi:hypothetical protein
MKRFLTEMLILSCNFVRRLPLTREFRKKQWDFKFISHAYRMILSATYRKPAHEYLTGCNAAPYEPAQECEIGCAITRKINELEPPGRMTAARIERLSRRLLSPLSAPIER